VRRWLLLMILLTPPLGQAQAQQTARLSIDPPTQTVAPSQGTFQVRIMVDDVINEQGLGGYTLVMEYDPSVLEARSIADSGFIESTDNAVLCPTSGIDKDEGRLAHFCLTLPILAQPGPQTSAPQLLVTVTFEPVGEGTTTLDISETSLVDAQGDDLNALLSKLARKFCHRSQLRGADRRKIFRVGKENHPAIPDPFMETDRALSGFRGEIRYDISQSNGHDILLS